MTAGRDQVQTSDLQIGSPTRQPLDHRASTKESGINIIIQAQSRFPHIM